MVLLGLIDMVQKLGVLSGHSSQVLCAVAPCTVAPSKTWRSGTSRRTTHPSRPSASGDLMRDIDWMSGEDVVPSGEVITSKDSKRETDSDILSRR